MSTARRRHARARHGFWMLVLGTIGLVTCVSLAPAQTARDSAIYRQLKPPTDSIAASLKRYCGLSSKTAYMLPACRNYGKLAPSESALIATTVTPVPSPVPTPTPAPVGPTDAELPRVFLTTTIASTPANGKQWHVAATGNLQAALDSAACGDRVLLAANATYRGNYTIAKACSAIAWIWLMTEGCASLPAENVRVSPAAAACYAKLVSPNVSPALTTSTFSIPKFWRVIGVALSNDAAVSPVNGTVILGDASPAQNSLSLVPSDLILDRVYLQVPATQDDRRCVAINTARTAVIDSYIGGCKSLFDAQAITGTNGPGPFKIVNNHLEGAAEVIAFGGADPGIVGLVPSDIEIRHNYLTKPQSWVGVWLTKNLIEFKVGSRVLIDGNVLENSFVDAQAGNAFVIWSVNQNGGCTWCTANDFTITNNLIRNVAGVWALTPRYNTNSHPLRNVTIRNNLVIGLNASTGNGRIVNLGDTIPNLTVEHNTALSSSGGIAVLWSSQTKFHQTIRDNLFAGMLFATWGAGSLAWNAVADATSVLSTNTFAFQSTWLNVQPGNWYPTTYDELGLVGGGTAATNVNAAPGDLALSASSPYKGKSSDGTDVGVNLAALLAAIQGVKP